MITQEMINQLWEEASVVQNLSRDEWRLDPCGALIKKDHYANRDSDYGWEIDHVVSKSFLISAGATEAEYDHMDNLRVMHWANNDSKGTNYPEYKAVRTCVNGKNVIIEAFYTVNKDLQRLLKSRFTKFGI